MKELLQQLAAYNCWANQKLCEVALSLPEDLQTKHVESSFDTIQKTLLHMWDAESIWWQRVKLQEAVTAPSANFKGNTRDVATALMHQNKLWETWINNASAAALDHVIMYYTSKRVPVKININVVLMQVLNHGTYHRGQLVTMFRQLGVSKIPQTDFFIWAMGRKGR